MSILRNQLFGNSPLEGSSLSFLLLVQKIGGVSVTMVDVCECVSPNLNPGWHQAALWQPSHQTVPMCTSVRKCVPVCTTPPNCTSYLPAHEGRMIAAHHVQHLASVSPGLGLPPACHPIPSRATQAVPNDTMSYTHQRLTTI